MAHCNGMQAFAVKRLKESRRKKKRKKKDEVEKATKEMNTQQCMYLYKLYMHLFLLVLASLCVKRGSDKCKSKEESTSQRREEKARERRWNELKKVGQTCSALPRPF